MSEPTLWQECRNHDPFGEKINEVDCCEGLMYGAPVKPDLDTLANEIALEFLPDTGPCAFCDAEVGARHRVADAIVGRIAAALGIGGDDGVDYETHTLMQGGTGGGDG